MGFAKIKDDDEVSQVVTFGNFTRLQKLRYEIFSPARLLILLFIINIFIYFDRGAISAVVPYVEKYWKINKTQQGALASAFMVGYMVFCPIFAELASRLNASTILAIGLFGWSIMTFLCGMSGFNSQKIWGYYMLVGCRCLVGIGEAAFAPIAPTIIDDTAPEKSKTTYMSIFYIALPCGAALGYGISGFLSSFFSWRLPFFLEGIIMLFLSALCLLVPPADTYKQYRAYKEAVENGTFVPSESTDGLSDLQNETSTLVPKASDQDSPVPEEAEIAETATAQPAEKKANIFQAIYLLSTNPTYCFAALAATAYTFVVGGLAFWAPTIVAELLHWTPENANLGFSGVCVIAGLFGSFFGGLLLDLIGGAGGFKGAVRAFLLCTLYILISIPFGTAAFLSSNPILFFILLSIAELFVFGITSPMNVAFLDVVPKNLRNFSMSFQIFVLHLCGDMPSPILFGMLADGFGKKRGVLVAVHFLWSVLVLAVIFFFFAMLIARSKAKREERIKERKERLEIEAAQVTSNEL